MPESDQDSRFVRGARWLEANLVEYGPTLMVALAALGWTFWRTFITEAAPEEAWSHWAGRWALGSLLSACAVAGALLAYKRSGLIKRLKSEKGELEAEIDGLRDTVNAISSTAKDAWRSRLALIAHELNLNHTFRLNIYRYSPDTRMFRMVGRYASITKYNHVGRGVYPAETGCIGAAWESPTFEAIADDLPADGEAYVQVSCEKWNFDAETVKNLTMRSRSVYAFTLKDALEMDRTAVIVFESTEPKAADQDKLRQAVNITYRKQLLSDLDNLKIIEPSLKLAQVAGF